MKNFESNPAGSSDSAREQNERAIREAEERLEALKMRAERGEAVNDQEVKNLYEKIRTMKAHQESTPAE